MEISHAYFCEDMGLKGLMAVSGHMESLISPDQLIIIKCRSSAMVFTSQMRSEQKRTCLFNNMQVLKINHLAHQNWNNFTSEGYRRSAFFMKKANIQYVQCIVYSIV